MQVHTGTYFHIHTHTHTKVTTNHASTYWYILPHSHTHTHTKVTTTFHFKSGLIRLAMPARFPTTLDPFIAHSFLPLCSILHRQTLARPNCHSQGFTS
jgi:hypothetical protein